MKVLQELTQKNRHDFGDFREIIRILRSENGCSWDKEQTHKSLRNSLVEETYEAVEAIDNESASQLKEELGDILLQIFFHARISEECGDFNIDDVCDEICKKMIIRHPHIFSDLSEENLSSLQAQSSWENVKIKEKGYIDTKEYIESTAKSLPSLMRAEKIQKRLVKRGVAKNPGSNDIVRGIKTTVESIDSTNITTELIGEALYKIVSLAIDNGIDSEQALYGYNNKTIELSFCD